MPRFNQQCACGWRAEIIAAPFEMPPCPTCGGATERLWIQSSSVVGDEIPGGKWIENLGHQPMFFESKSAILAEAKRRGLEPMVRHVPVPGSDKSPHTTSWAAVSQYQMDAATALVMRVTSPQLRDPAPVTVGPLATVDLVAEVFPL